MTQHYCFRCNQAFKCVSETAGLNVKTQSSPNRWSGQNLSMVKKQQQHVFMQNSSKSKGQVINFTHRLHRNIIYTPAQSTCYARNISDEQHTLELSAALPDLFFWGGISTELNTLANLWIVKSPALHPELFLQTAEHTHILSARQYSS